MIKHRFAIIVGNIEHASDWQAIEEQLNAAGNEGFDICTPPVVTRLTANGIPWAIQVAFIVKRSMQGHAPNPYLPQVKLEKTK